MFVASPNSLRPNLNALMTKWHKLLESVRDPYWPELYYMRGPGPKWRAKHLVDRI